MLSSRAMGRLAASEGPVGDVPNDDHNGALPLGVRVMKLLLRTHWWPLKAVCLEAGVAVCTQAAARKEQAATAFAERWLQRRFFEELAVATGVNPPDLVSDSDSDYYGPSAGVVSSLLTSGSDSD